MPSQKKYNIPEEDHQELNEPQADYEKAEMDLLREGLKRSYKERFLFATMLYKVQRSMKKATIVYRPDNLTK